MGIPFPPAPRRPFGSWYFLPLYLHFFQHLECDVSSIHILYCWFYFKVLKIFVYGVFFISMLWIIYMNCEIVEINFWRCVFVVVMGLLWVSNCWLGNYNRKKNAFSNGITDGIAFPLAIPSGFATKKNFLILELIVKLIEW